MFLFTTGSTRKRCVRTVPQEMQKPKSGLKRHKTVKHKDTRDVVKTKEGEQESYLTFVAYSRIVEKAKHKKSIHNQSETS